MHSNLKKINEIVRCNGFSIIGIDGKSIKLKCNRCKEIKMFFKSNIYKSLNCSKCREVDFEKKRLMAISLVADNNTLTDVAKRVGVGLSTLKNWKIYSYKNKDLRLKRFIKLYNRGTPIKQIQKELSICDRTLQEYKELSNVNLKEKAEYKMLELNIQTYLDADIPIVDIIAKCDINILKKTKYYKMFLTHLYIELKLPLREVKKLLSISQERINTLLPSYFKRSSVVVGNVVNGITVVCVKKHTVDYMCHCGRTFTKSRPKHLGVRLKGCSKCVIGSEKYMLISNMLKKGIKREVISITHKVSVKTLRYIMNDIKNNKEVLCQT